MEAAAARIGMSTSHWSAVERDKVVGREGQPLGTPADTVARMLSVLPPLAGDHVEALKRVRPGDAAEILAAVASPPGAVAGAADDDRVMEKLIESRDDSEFLWFLWRKTGNDMKLLPRATRVRDVLQWVDTHPAGPGPADAGSSADTAAPASETG